MNRSNTPPSKRLSRSQRASHHLAEVERQMAYASALFLSIGDGAIATDEQGKISRINKQALKILGFKKEEVIGQWFQKVFIGVDQNGQEIDLMNRPITKAILSGESVSAKMYYKPRAGKPIPVSVTVSPIMFNGAPVGAIEVFRDITRELEIDNMKSEFISLASHQLRTPLTAITTYTHMLSQGFQGKVTDEQQEFLKTILASAERMNELIDTLLNVSRLEAGYVKIDAKQTNVVSILEGAIHELWPLAKSKRQELTIRTTSEEIIAHTDELLITELFTNLMSNAIKYTPDEGKIGINVHESANYVIVDISDTGFGIPEDLQARVFTKFFRAPNILKQDTVGTGLGLYMVKEIVTHLHGKITFSSKENKGTTFTVKLPKKKLQAEEDPEDLDKIG